MRWPLCKGRSIRRCRFRLENPLLRSTNVSAPWRPAIISTVNFCELVTYHSLAEKDHVCNGDDLDGIEPMHAYQDGGRMYRCTTGPHWLRRRNSIQPDATAGSFYDQRGSPGIEDGCTPNHRDASCIMRRPTRRPVSKRKL